MTPSLTEVIANEPARCDVDGCNRTIAKHERHWVTQRGQNVCKECRDAIEDARAKQQQQQE